MALSARRGGRGAAGPGGSRRTFFIMPPLIGPAVFVVCLRNALLGREATDASSAKLSGRERWNNVFVAAMLAASFAAGCRGWLVFGPSLRGTVARAAAIAAAGTLASSLAFFPIMFLFAMIELAHMERAQRRAARPKDT